MFDTQSTSRTTAVLEQTLPFQHVDWAEALRGHTSGLFLVTGLAGANTVATAFATVGLLGPSAHYAQEITCSAALEEALSIAEQGGLVVATLAVESVEQVASHLRMLGADLDRVESMTRAVMAQKAFQGTGEDGELTPPVVLAEILAFEPGEPATALVVGRAPAKTIQDTALSLMHQGKMGRGCLVNAYGADLQQITLDSAMKGQYPRSGLSFPTIARRVC